MRANRRPFPWRVIRLSSDRYVLDLLDVDGTWQPWNDYAITKRQAFRFMAQARRMQGN